MACSGCGKVIAIAAKGVEVAGKLLFDARVSDAEYWHRLAICSVYECGLQHTSKLGVEFCGLSWRGERNEVAFGCGCCLSAKALLEDEHCPRGTW